MYLIPVIAKFYPHFSLNLIRWIGLVDILGLIDVIDFSIISAAFGVIVGVVNSIYSSRRAEKQRQTEIEARQAQLFMGIFSYVLDPEFLDMYWKVLGMQWEDYEDFVTKYMWTDERKYQLLALRYFDGIGVMTYNGLIDISLVRDLMGPSVIRFWEKFEPIIKERRIKLDWPDMWMPTEYLYNKVKEKKRTFEI
jgi:hypothetical protein